MSVPNYDDIDNIIDKIETNTKESKRQISYITNIIISAEPINGENRFNGKVSSKSKRMEDGVDCNECGKHLSTKTNLAQHKKSVHEGIKYSCAECPYQASHKPHLTKHKRAVHEGIKYTCKECRHQTSRKETLVLHNRIVHERIRYPC